MCEYLYAIRFSVGVMAAEKHVFIFIASRRRDNRHVVKGMSGSCWLTHSSDMCRQKSIKS